MTLILIDLLNDLAFVNFILIDMSLDNKILIFHMRHLQKSKYIVFTCNSIFTYLNTLWQ